MNSWLNLSGVIQNRATGEAVQVAGEVHLVVDVTGSQAGGWVVRVTANLQDTKGTGESTGQSYRGTGSDKTSEQFIAGPSLELLVFDPTFILSSPNDKSPLPVLVTVALNADGTISSVTGSIGGGGAT